MYTYFNPMKYIDPGYSHAATTLPRYDAIYFKFIEENIYSA